MELVHGGDWAGYEEIYGDKPLDFSANISPLGLPENVREAITNTLATAERYPDPLCRKLCAAIATNDHVDKSYCLCGNGAADLIFRAVLAIKPKSGLIVSPCFAEYEQALNTVQCDVVEYNLKASMDYVLDKDFLDYIKPGIDMVFLCQPNNPTGLTVDRTMLYEVLNRCKAIKAILLLDECFVDFLDQPAKYTMAEALSDYNNLIIIKAFTKIYAMAGIRLGYCLCSNGELLDKMRNAGQPWAVSSIAQESGVAALQNVNYVNQVRDLISIERPWLKENLCKLGLRVIDGQANFLLFYCEQDLIEPLKHKGILLRSCANYKNLCAGWYRTAVRSHGENVRLIETLRQVLT